MSFTRALLDKLFSFIIAARTTYTAATRHLSGDVQCFRLRRQDVAKLGTAMLRIFTIPPETGRCPRCGPNPEFIIIDGQALGCSDVDDVDPKRLDMDCPVLDIPTSKLCLVEHAPLRAAITKVVRTSAALTEPQQHLLRSWHEDMTNPQAPAVERAAAFTFFHFFPLRSRAAAEQPQTIPKEAEAPPAAETPSGRRKRKPTGDRTLEAAVRRDDQGNLVLGGSGPVAKRAVDAWRDRTGMCAPRFELYPRHDDGAWLAALPFLQALLAETVTGMFQAHDERSVRLVANTMRLKRNGEWQNVTGSLDGVGFVASFVGRFADDIDADERLCQSVGRLLVEAADREASVDMAFNHVSNSKEVLDRGWVNAEYCKRWGGTPTPADYRRWRTLQSTDSGIVADSPFVSYEHFAGLDRVRPGIKDSEAAKRRVGYRGKDRHTADKEGDGDACNKAFSIKCGLTQGVFNVVCPHVITLGFRCLFRAESVGEALSIVLERFSKLPKVIFYDVACKLDKNALRRVRPILREHNVRCILDRPHSITHSCSPVYMPDESLGSTAGVATQAAEVSHSIAVGNRTSLAYMAPSTYMVHKIVQVALMNVRKLQRLFSDTTGENDHVPLAPFYHQRLSRKCERGWACQCQPSLAAEGRAVESLAAEDASLPDLGASAVMLEDKDNTAANRVATMATTTRQMQECNVGLPALPSDGTRRSPVRRRDRDALGDSDGSRRSPATERRYASISRTALSPTETALMSALAALPSPDSPVRVVNKARVTLTAADLALFRGDSWLNAEVMNSFVALINHRDSAARELGLVTAGRDGEAQIRTSASTLPLSFMFGTFFFSRLSERTGSYDYDGVRRWGVKNNLRVNDVDLILVPVNIDNAHWVLVAIDVRDRSLHYYDSLRGEDRASVMPLLQRWLQDEVSTRLGADVAEQWGIQNWPTVTESSWPLQTDGGSCGVFVLAAADCLSTGAPVSFTQADVPVLRNRMALSLVSDDLTSVGHVPFGALKSTTASLADLDLVAHAPGLDRTAEVYDAESISFAGEMEGKANDGQGNEPAEADNGVEAYQDDEAGDADEFSNVDALEEGSASDGVGGNDHDDAAGVEELLDEEDGDNHELVAASASSGG